MDAKWLAIPTVAAGGAGGSYLGYQYLHQKGESIKTKLGDLLLKFDDSFNEKWKARASLVSSKDTLPESLNKLRSSSGNKEISEANIKEWCKDQIEKEFTSETDSLFVSIRDYCTFNNKDKLGDKVISEDLESGNIKSSGKWSTANEKLKSASEDGMSSTMKEIKAKVSNSSGGTQDTKALRTWCEGIYPSYYKGEDDSDFKDAKAYCVEK
ncbi:hypothetical protein HF1_13780 [Mycoplasma haemofelis str. Langford 1]|uniref:Uncharacterized protein n=1 Tax=Mycoplasma haemofelis (strain Langford 1) TaxID=941640 RepID=E8ZJR5_MYCHL|nr:hypothetical protein [Mycoplasma haemofelis]CBY93386.1 hypothetical protein HF1_13780 [Mycoplasma haemofelis str. Langford 1]